MSTMQEGCKEERSRLFCVVSIDRTRAIDTNWHTGDPFWTSGNVFCCGDGWELAQVDQRGCRVSILRGTQKQSGHSPEQLVWVTLLEEDHWTKWLLEVPSNLSHSGKWLWRKKLLDECLTEVKNQLNGSLQCILATVKANWVLICVSKREVVKSRKVSIMLSDIFEATFEVLCSVWGSPVQESL